MNNRYFPDLTEDYIARRAEDLNDKKTLEQWARKAPARVPLYVQAARTTWRYGCTIVAGAFLGILISRLIPLCVGSYQPLEDLRMVVACGIGAAVALGYCNDVPKWYVRAVKFMGSAEE